MSVLSNLPNVLSYLHTQSLTSDAEQLLLEICRAFGDDSNAALSTVDPMLIEHMMQTAEIQSTYKRATILNLTSRLGRWAKQQSLLAPQPPAAAVSPTLVVNTPSQVNSPSPHSVPLVFTPLRSVMPLTIVEDQQPQVQPQPQQATHVSRPVPLRSCLSFEDPVHMAAPVALSPFHESDSSTSSGRTEDEPGAQQATTDEEEHEDDQAIQKEENNKHTARSGRAWKASSVPRPRCSIYQHLVKKSAGAATTATITSPPQVTSNAVKIDDPKPVVATSASAARAATMPALMTLQQEIVDQQPCVEQILYHQDAHDCSVRQCTQYGSWLLHTLTELEKHINLLCCPVHIFKTADTFKPWICKVDQTNNFHSSRFRHARNPNEFSMFECDLALVRKYDDDERLEMYKDASAFEIRVRANPLLKRKECDYMALVPIPNNNDLISYMFGGKHGHIESIVRLAKLPILCVPEREYRALPWLQVLVYAKNLDNLWYAIRLFIALIESYPRRPQDIRDAYDAVTQALERVPTPKMVARTFNSTGKSRTAARR